MGISAGDDDSSIVTEIVRGIVIVFAVAMMVSTISGLLFVVLENFIF